MKRIISIFLAILVFALSIDTGVYHTFAATDNTVVNIWGGLQSANSGGSFVKGNGTEEDPYIIENGDQLYLMVYNFGTTDKQLNGNAAHYKLGCDIYLNDISNYSSWGKSGFDMSSLNNWSKFEDSFCHRTFYGNFNGDGHTIYGLYAHSYRISAFFPNVGHGAVIRNVNFKNSYIVNTSNINSNDQEDLGDTVGQKIWYAGAYGSAGVLLSRADAAGDSDYNTVDYTINNCSIIDAYVEAKYFTSAFVAAANSCQPYIANCMTANITLNSTSSTQGVEGAIMNMPYGSTNPTCNMENILAVGYPIYGASRDEMWSGLKKPSMSHTYTFKNVYSTVSNKYTFNHSSFGNVSFTDTEVTVVDASKLIGAEAEKTIPNFDWAYTWRSVENDYPVPMREYIVPNGEKYYENGGPKYTTDTWDGTVAGHFAAGNGSLEDPYLIANCEEFYRMVTMPEADKHYKIANGVTDLYFNDIEGKSYSTLMTYFSWGIGTKYVGDNGAVFSGCFDGNGVTMHGVYVSATNNAALFSKLGNATLKNFTVRYSYFKTSSSSAMGAAVIAAEVKENSTAQIKNIAVIDSNVDGKTSAAGFVGNAKNNSKVYIENCIVSAGKIESKGQPAYQAAFVANATNAQINVKNSISLGIHPASSLPLSYNGTYVNVYTDTAATEAASGVNVVANSALQGETVKSTCAEFNWNYSWGTTATIPMPKNQQRNNGIVGNAWTGEIAMSFAGGNGTKTNPYQINTAEMLARMLVFGNSGDYYRLTADIYINDISKENWQSGALEWFTSNDVSAFEGCLDGNGLTVYGLYANANEQNEYAALIPVMGTAAQVTKIKLNNAYLTGVKGAYLGAIAGVLQDNASVMASINACLVNDNVTFTGEANVGGIIASVGFSRLRVENCAFRGSILSTGNSYGICESVIGELLLNEIICLNYNPFPENSNVIAKNVYTDAVATQPGVIVLTRDKMIGITARNHMTALDYTALWRLSTSNTPEPINNNKAYNGVKGDVWSGRIASSFAGGNGSESNPFIIETGEQLALMISKANNYADKYFKLGCDIYLNNVSDELWQAKSGAQQWLTSHDVGYFKSHLDGNGYVVFGMYYNFKSTPSSTYMGLIPRFAGSAVVKNLGVSQAYIKAARNDNTIYAGGIFGMGSAFYDFYGNKVNFNQTVGDEFLVPGQSTPTKLPSITNCFVDHTCYIEATSVGGIGCPGGAAIVVRDCIVTARLKGDDTVKTREGGIIGAYWTYASRVYNSVSFTQSNSGAVGGTQVNVRDVGGSVIYLENMYYHGNQDVFGTTRVKRPQWRIGEYAKNAMPELDWENTWRVEENGTPVLRVFDKADRSAAMFSDKSYVIPEVKVTFETGVDGLVVEDLIGKAYEKIELPVPERKGYKFVAWHGFEDLSCEYEYDFFLPRDITLYAEWKDISVTQDFEKYPYTKWDCDTSVWRYNTPQNDIEYNGDYVHSGKNSMQLMSLDGDVATLLINYKNTLTAGQRYTISFWTISSNGNLQPQFALAHKIYPDYMAADKLTEPITSQSQTDGKWTQYTYTFEALTPWVAIKVLGGDGIYIDDIVITLDGELLLQTETSTDVIEAEFYGSTYNNVVLSKGVSSVGEFAFAFNKFLTDIYISDSVTQIGEYAFYDCEHVKDVWYAGSEEDFKRIVIEKNNSSLKKANWHFGSCAIGQEHIYDDENDNDCNLCGKLKNGSESGDVNGDGSIDNRDYALLMQYLNGWDVEIDQTVADVNADKSVDNRDYALLMQYLNGWDIELTS